MRRSSLMELGGGGSLQSPFSINNQTGTSYTIQSSDLGRIITFNNAAASTIIAVTLPQAGASFPSGWWTILKNIGNNYVRITPTTSTLEGCAQAIIPCGGTLAMVSNGTNYLVLNTDVSGPSSTSVPAYFGVGGLLQWMSNGQGAIVDAANSVIGQDILVAQDTIVRTIFARTSTGVAATTGAFGLYDVNGNRLLTTGAQATTTNNTNVGAAVTSTYLVAGLYKSAWTASTNVTLTFIAEGTFTYGAGAAGLYNLQTVRYFKATNGAVAGDLPTILGALISAISVLNHTSNVPIISYES